MSDGNNIWDGPNLGEEESDPRESEPPEPDYADDDATGQDDYTFSDRAYADRLDYARECQEKGDWRDPGEIRMGA